MCAFFADEERGTSLYYACTSNAAKCSHLDASGSFDALGTSYGTLRWKDNCFIKMVLNTKHKTLEFYVDGEYQGIAFENIQFDQDINYYLAVSMCTTNTDEVACVMELIEFQQTIHK